MRIQMVQRTLLPLPACGERSAREARRVRGALNELDSWRVPLTPTLSPAKGRLRPSSTGYAGRGSERACSPNANEARL
jgi:hypothetical protein